MHSGAQDASHRSMQDACKQAGVSKRTLHPTAHVFSCAPAFPELDGDKVCEAATRGVLHHQAQIVRREHHLLRRYDVDMALTQL